MKIWGRRNRSVKSKVVDRRHRGRFGRVSGATGLAITSAARFVAGAAGTLRATQASAADTTSALQAFPDSTLRSLAATSVGLGAGFFLAGKPRLIVVAGIAPALLAGIAMVLRPVAAVPRATEAG